MIRLLLLLTLLAPAPGFRDSARLTPIASELAGRPVLVRCARTKDDWVAFLNEIGLTNAVRGVVLPERDAAYLSPNVCRHLEGWLRGKDAPTVATVGSDALTLAHESMHLHGLLDEHDTDCAALKALPRVLRERFRVRSPRNLMLAMRSAQAWHDSAPPLYAGPC